MNFFRALATVKVQRTGMGFRLAAVFEEGQSGHQAAKARVSPNRRAIKLQKAFEKLKPVEQQLVLKQVEGLAGQK